MSLNLPESYPEILTTAAHAAFEEISKLLPDMPEVKRGVIAFNVAEAIRRNCGGSMVYISKGESYERSNRDRQIWDEFNGRNIPELARKHDLTESQLYTIIRAQRAIAQQESQGELPGL